MMVQSANLTSNSEIKKMQQCPLMKGNNYTGLFQQFIKAASLRNMFFHGFIPASLDQMRNPVHRCISVGGNTIWLLSMTLYK